MEKGNAGALQSDGKIIVAADATLDAQRDPTLVRLNPDGSIDVGFGDEGLLFLADQGFDPSFGTAADVLVQPDGKIVVVGIVTGNNFGVARFNPDGSPDPNFSEDGAAQIEFNVEDISVPYAVALQGTARSS